MVTSQNRAGFAEPRLKMWDKNVGQNLGQKFGTDGQTNKQTDKTKYRVALQLKMLEMIK